MRAWLRRPSFLRVEALDGEPLLLHVDRPDQSEGWLSSVDGGLAPLSAVNPAVEDARPDDRLVVGGDGLVLHRPFEAHQADDPMYVNYHWVAMLDPVELADAAWHERPEDLPVFLDAVREVDHHGRPAWEALLHPTDAYDPRCSCCALLFSAESEARDAEAGAPTVSGREPGLRYADAHRVRLDVGTGVCVLTEEIGGSRAGYGHEVVIEAVDQPMGEELFQRPRRRWFRR